MLLDDQGAVTARLNPATGGPPKDGSRSPFTDPPVVNAAARQAFAVPDPLPTRLRPATRATLLGRWVPSGAGTVQRPKVPFLRLDADGSWTSSDGCNGSMGRWTAGSDGRVLATSGVSTLIGCHNVEVAQWWSTAARAGFDGSALVLIDRDGNELARLAR
jgi:heat shock protein HslJ